MHVQFVVALGQLDFSRGLDPLSLLVGSSQPHLDATYSVVDIGPQVFLVVGGVVLPDLKVPSSLRRH